MEKKGIEGLQEDKMYTADEVRKIVKQEIGFLRHREKERSPYAIFRRMVESDVSVDLIEKTFEGFDHMGWRRFIEQEKANYWRKRIKNTPYIR